MVYAKIMDNACFRYSAIKVKSSLKNCFEFLQKVFSRLDVFVFVCALAVFGVFKTHPKSAYDKFKTVPKKYFIF